MGQGEEHGGRNGAHGRGPGPALQQPELTEVVAVLEDLRRGRPAVVLHAGDGNAAAHDDVEAVSRVALLDDDPARPATAP